MPEEKSKRPQSRPYPAELKSRAIRLVQETIESEGSSYGVVVRIAGQLGIDPDTVRGWIRRAGVADGGRPDEQRRLIALERENRELRRANEILKAASTFFAAELDRREKR
jgi:transposase